MAVGIFPGEILSMANSRVPGPIGLIGPRPEINDGTLARAPSPRPGSVGMPAASPSPAPVATDLSWAQIKADMQLHEALILHLYLDSQNKVTVGVGNMLPTLGAAQALAFVLRSDGVSAATPEQIKVDWDSVNAEAGKNKRAESFARLTLLDLPEAVCWSLLKKRIDGEFLPLLKKLFSGWSSFPTPAKRALLDMAYNLGPKRLKKFDTLIGHAKKGEWEKAADACLRKKIPDERNEWTQARFREAMWAGGAQ